MITNSLLKRINSGDREAFKAVYDEYGRGMYLTALKTLNSEAAARSVVKQAFLNLHRELLNAADDIDIPVRIRELMDHEILLMKIVGAHGSLDSATLDNEAFTSAKPAPEASSARGAFEDEGSAVANELPLLERARAYMEADGALPPEAVSKKAPVRPKRRSGWFGKLLLFLLLFILLWALAGVLMDVKVLPAYDLGYRWFNQTVYPLFMLFS